MNLSGPLCLFIECYQSVLQVLRYTNVFAFDQGADFLNTASKLLVTDLTTEG